MEPLINLTRGVKLTKNKSGKGGMTLEGEFLWTDECTRAFEEIKRRLASAPVVVCPDFNRSFFVFCFVMLVGSAWARF